MEYTLVLIVVQSTGQAQAIDGARMIFPRLADAAPVSDLGGSILSHRERIATVEQEKYC